MVKVLVGCLCLLSAVLVAMPTAWAENLPVPVERYSHACLATAGTVSLQLDSGNSGVVYCTWAPARDRTECKVGSNQVTVCTIRCATAICLAANPNRTKPVWPLKGGPKRAAPADTLAPGELAPAN